MLVPFSRIEKSAGWHLLIAKPTSVINTCASEVLRHPLKQQQLEAAKEFKMTTIKSSVIATHIQEWIGRGEKAIQIAYKPEWANGTGYFDHAITDRSLFAGVPAEERIGLMLTFVDEHGRHGFITYTRLGNVVVFDRYNNATVVTSNYPKALNGILPQGQWDKEQLNQWFYSNDYCIGAAIENVAEGLERLNGK